MPETVSGRLSVPTHGDTEHWFKDTLQSLDVRLSAFESGLAAALAALAELAAMIAAMAEPDERAAAILRRAMDEPGRPRLRVVPPRGQSTG